MARVMSVFQNTKNWFSTFKTSTDSSKYKLVLEPFDGNCNYV